MKCLRTQADVLAAWLAGQEAHTRRGNFRGTTNADGSGQLTHYRTLEAIRTRSGLVFANTQCWAIGRATCTGPHLGRPEQWSYKANPADPDGPWIRDHLVRPAEPPQATAALPLSLLEALLGAKLYGIVRVREDPEHRRGSQLVHLEDGTAAYVGWDDNPDDRHTQCFAFRLTEPEARRIRNPAQALALLKPPAVRRAEAAGLKVRRQGEWFFIPTQGQPRWVYRRGRPLDNHTPLEWGVPDADPVQLGYKLLAPDYQAANPSGLPESVLSMTGPILDDWAPADLSTERAGQQRLHAATQILVRGCVRHTGARVGSGMHTRPQHSPLSLGRTWHRAVTHGRTCLTWNRTQRGGRRNFD